MESLVLIAKLFNDDEYVGTPGILIFKGGLVASSDNPLGVRLRKDFISGITYPILNKFQEKVMINIPSRNLEKFKKFASSYYALAPGYT